MAKRIFTTVVLWLAILAALLFFRTNGALVLIAVMAVLTLRELYQLMSAAGYAPFVHLGTVFGTLIAVSPWLETNPWVRDHLGSAGHSLVALATVVFSIRILGERLPEKRVEALASTLFGLVYVGLMLQYLVRIMTPNPLGSITPDGRLLLGVWLVATAKFCDVGALLTGLAIGRHKMAPGISPKKTWEGAIGGVIVSAAVGALVARLGAGLVPSFTPLWGAALAVPIALTAIVSDLVESVIKRRADSKDSGGTVPGIGGVFDLTDSILLPAPVGYLLLGLVLGLS